MLNCNNWGGVRREDLPCTRLYTGLDISNPIKIYKIIFKFSAPDCHSGGFTDTLSNTWNKVKQFVSESPLAQKVVKQGLAKGKELAKDVAGKAVQMGLEKLGVPESAMGTATALADEAFDRIGDAAKRKAQSAVISKASTTFGA
eukprot:SAG31_NODE_3428_length_4289_cov_3.615990_2_plen_144_part_00